MAANGILLRGGRVIDPANNLDGMLDVLIQDGCIAAVGPDLKANGAEMKQVLGRADRDASESAVPAGYKG